MKTASIVAAGAIYLSFAAATSQAAFTYPGGWTAPGGNYSEVGQVSADPSEANFVQILNTLYGGSFAGTNSKLFGDTTYASNNGIVATRVQDYNVGSPLNQATGDPLSADDQLWTDGGVPANVDTKAVYASFTQKFGYYDGTQAGAINPTILFEVNDVGFQANGSASNVQFGSQYGFMRTGSYRSHYSQQAFNLDRRDHMLTYEITGLADGQKTWLLFFEDKYFGEAGFDFDFNDLVVQVKTAAPVPAPAAAGLGVIGLATVSLLKRRQQDT